MSASLSFEQEYCPFCGTDTDHGQRYCHGCGSLLEGLEMVTFPIPSTYNQPHSELLINSKSFLHDSNDPASKKVMPFHWTEDEPQDLVFPTWIQYAGVIQSLTKPLLFWDVLDQVLGQVQVTFPIDEPRIVFHFQFTSQQGVDPERAEWTLQYELNQNRQHCWHIYDPMNQSIGIIESVESTKREKCLLARDIHGTEVALHASWSIGRAFQNSWLKIILDLLFDTNLWQGFGSTYSISCRSKELPEKNYGLLSAGGLGGTFYQFNRCHELTSEVDFRLVFSILALQGFGIWDTKSFDDLLKLRY